MTHADPEIQKSFEAIRALCRGEHVPAPPGWYDDAGDTLDIMRGAGWVHHAFSEPDYKGINVLKSEFWDSEEERVMIVPDLERGADPVDIQALMTGLTELVSTCVHATQSIKPALEHAPEDRAFHGMGRKKRPELAEDIIRILDAEIASVGGRVDSDGEWRDLPEKTLSSARAIVARLVKEISGGRMSVHTYARTGRDTVITYPKKGRADPYALDSASYALMSAGNVLTEIGKQARFADSEARREISAKKEAEALQAQAQEIRQACFEVHADSLRQNGGSAALAILQHLEKGFRLPVYKGSARRPTPERDALIDDLHEFFGDDTYDILSEQISSDPSRRLNGVKRLSERLDVIFSDAEPAPGL